MTMSISTGATASFEEDTTKRSTTSDEMSEYSSDEGSQGTSYIDSDLQELYLPFRLRVLCSLKKPRGLLDLMKSPYILKQY